MSAVDILGYAASMMVLVTFCMSSMLPLRCVALASNVLFSTYGYLTHAYPILVLHTVLFPLNAVRIAQILRRPAATGLGAPHAGVRFRLPAMSLPRLTQLAGALCAMAVTALVIPASFVMLSDKAQAQVCKTLSGEFVHCAAPALHYARLDFIPGCTGPETKGRQVRFGNNIFVCSGRQR